MKPCGVSLSVASLLLASMANGQSVIRGRIQGSGGESLQGDITLVFVGSSGLTLTNHQTDTRGHFSIPVTVSPSTIVAKADGHVSAETSVSAVPRDYVLILDRAAVVAGRVVDETGQGVADATVAIRYLGQQRRFHFGQEQGNISTDKLGYFTLPFVAADKPFVVDAFSETRPVSSSPVQIATVEGLKGIQIALVNRGQTVRVELEPGGSSPIAGLKVMLRATGDGEPYSAEVRSGSAFQSQAVRVKAFSGQSVEFHGVPAGRITVIAEASGQRRKVDAVVRREEPLVVRIPLPALGR
jgi:hypothetical protein